MRAHLPAYARPAARFAYITGWRLKSEILPLQWRQVDFRAGIVRLDVGTTKNNDGRTFPMTPELLATLEAQRVATNAPSAQNRQHHPVGVPLDEAGPTA